MLHPEQAGVKKATIKAEMSKKFKASEDRIAVFGLKTKFGGGRSSCFVHVFDDLDSRKKYDTKTNLVRVSFKCSRMQSCQRPAVMPGADGIV